MSDPRYPVFDADRRYAATDPLYAERFCACGGIFRMRAYAPMIRESVKTFEDRHDGPNCSPISRAEWPAARQTAEKRSALQTVLNEQIANGASADQITKAVSKAEAAFKPRELPNFDPTANPED